MKTHRCKYSLEAGASIRFGRKYNWYRNDEPPAWYLRFPEYDSYMEVSLSRPINIIFCPFCGSRLEVPAVQ